jgi:hypothetical protein
MPTLPSGQRGTGDCSMPGGRMAQSKGAGYGE